MSPLRRPRQARVLTRTQVQAQRVARTTHLHPSVRSRNIRKNNKRPMGLGQQIWSLLMKIRRRNAKTGRKGRQMSTIKGSSRDAARANPHRWPHICICSLSLLCERCLARACEPHPILFCVQVAIRRLPSTLAAYVIQACTRHKKEGPGHTPHTRQRQPSGTRQRRVRANVVANLQPRF